MTEHSRFSTDQYVSCRLQCASGLCPWTCQVCCIHGGITNLAEHHGVRYHLCASDSQLYDHSWLTNVSDTQRQLTRCVDEFSQWCASQRFQQNADKLKLSGSKLNIAKIDVSSERSSHRLSYAILVFWMYVAATCFYHQRQIHHRFSPEISTQHSWPPGWTTVSCESVLAALPQCWATSAYSECVCWPLLWSSA